MAYSTQRAVSDGTLALLDISIDYFDRTEIAVYFDGVLNTTDWEWVGTSDHQISFEVAVPLGVEVLVRRSTDTSEPRHVFSQGAAFVAESLDENTRQMLHIAQEAAEGSLGGDFFNDIDVHGHQIKNLGNAVADGDAVPFAQYKADALGVYNQRVLAENAKSAAEIASAAAVGAQASVQANAEAAVAAALEATESWDEFNEVWLGANASAPLVTNTGAALSNGMMYWKTAAPIGLYVYSAGAWAAAPQGPQGIQGVQGDKGDKGDKGDAGDGSGDVLGPAGDVTAGSLVIFSDITGTNIGPYGLTGMMKTTAGVPGIAVPGTDYIIGSHPANGITGTNITNWNSAYSWGNHASAGYLTSYTETDPVFNAHVAKTITGTAIGNWNTAFAWGSHALAGYASAATLAGTSGASYIGYNGISVATKLGSLTSSVGISVVDYGADGTGAADSYSAFMSAIGALPAGGGRIKVPGGTWRLNTEPTWGSKSMYWDIDPSAVFIGAGTGANKFPYQKLTNGWQMAVGPWIQSQSSQHSTSALGGIAALSVEMLQPYSYGSGQSVALYLGARGGCPDPNANVWALNPLIHVESTAQGLYQCIEVDVDVYSNIAKTRGVSCNGVGTYNAGTAFECLRSNSTRWTRGALFRHTVVGMEIFQDTSNTHGVVVGNAFGSSHACFAGIQYLNNTPMVHLGRITDSGPLGAYVRCVNAANTVITAEIQADGTLYSSANVIASGSAQAKNYFIAGGAYNAPAGVMCLGNSTTTSATTGSASALPALPAGYWTFYYGSQVIKVPYYL